MVEGERLRNGSSDRDFNVEHTRFESIGPLRLAWEAVDMVQQLPLPPQTQLPHPLVALIPFGPRHHLRIRKQGSTVASFHRCNSLSLSLSLSLYLSISVSLSRLIKTADLTDFKRDYSRRRDPDMGKKRLDARRVAIKVITRFPLDASHRIEFLMKKCWCLRRVAIVIGIMDW